MMTATMEDGKVLTRAEVAPKDTWNLEAIYKTPGEWENDFAQIDKLLKPIVEMKGKLNNPEALATIFKAQDTLHVLMERLYSFAHHREDEDTANSENQARSQRIASKLSQVSAEQAWIRPEILSQPAATLESWRDSQTLSFYKRTMVLLIREKAHTLSKEEETLISMAGEVFNNPHTTYGYLTNADMKFPSVKDDAGKDHLLTNGRYIPLMEKKDRALRQKTFETYYDTYKGLQNTLASTLSGSVKSHTFSARVRKFDSALAASLHHDNVPEKLYDTLIESTHEALPIFYEYLELRKKLLGVSDLNMWDVYVPIVPDFDIKVGWDEACEWVTEACKPLGPEYASGLKDCYQQRWIDVYENEGKRSGAYSGGSYSTYPYVLMNYQGTLDWVFTLAHELGHSLHSWLSNKTQPYRYADYSIFVAEIASTTNEMLLHHWLLENKAGDKRFRAYLLNHLCEQFRGTVYRQTMFAEFERLIHRMDADGTPLTAENLCNAYYDLNAKFFGGVIKADRHIASEWSRIPHFYYNFYVYKYATGFCASQLFYRQILSGTAGRDQYLNFLRTGGSADPLDQVKMGGVDLMDRKVLTSAFDTFKASVAELKGLLAGK